MPDNGPRYIERTKHYFIHADDIEAEPILSVEGPKARISQIDDDF